MPEAKMFCSDGIAGTNPTLSLSGMTERLNWNSEKIIDRFVLHLDWTDQ